MKKYFILFSFIAISLILVSTGYTAKTVIGYVNGEKLLMGVAYNNKWGSLMLTTSNSNVDWDNLSEPFHSYSEDWQSHPAGFPADWRAATGGGMYNVVTGTDNILQASCYGGTGRVLYGASASDTTWLPPVDFTITAKNIQLQYESNVTDPALWSIIRVGFAAAGGTNDFGIPIQVSSSGLYSYQFFCSTLMLDPAEQVYGVPRCVSIRDGQSIPLHAISYSGFTSSATLTFRLVVREPIPVEFCDANKDTLATIPSTGAYIKVEALDPFSFDSAVRDTTQVTLWTSSGDNETISLPELFDVQTTVGSLYNCNNNVFWNETPIPVAKSLSITPASIRMAPGQTTTFNAAGSAPIPSNGTIEGYGIATAYVSYGSATGSALVVFGGVAPFTWQSSNTTAGSIDSTTGVFTANTNGTVTITATDANGATGTAIVQILSTNAPIATETPTVYIHRSELFDTKF